VASLSFASALSSRGTIAALTLLCSSCAEARRTAGSALKSLSAAMALASSPRIRLLTVIDSGFSGIATGAPVAASEALSPSTMMTVSPASIRLSSAIALKMRTVSGSAVIVSFWIAATLTLESSSANWRTSAGSGAACAAIAQAINSKVNRVFSMNGSVRRVSQFQHLGPSLRRGARVGNTTNCVETESGL